MKIWDKPPPKGGPRDEEGGRLAKAAADKIAAAKRITAALAELGDAAEALFAADRAFCEAWHDRHGDWGHGGARLMRQLRPMLLSDLELSAPDMLRHLGQPRQSRARCKTIAEQIAWQVEQDLAAQPQPKEPAQ